MKEPPLWTLLGALAGIVLDGGVLGAAALGAAGAFVGDWIEG